MNLMLSYFVVLRNGDKVASTPHFVLRTFAVVVPLQGS